MVENILNKSQNININHLELKNEKYILRNSIKSETKTNGELFEVDNFIFKPIVNSKFTFIDLFAGIGGFRLALQNLGGRCVFTSEWDKDAQATYKNNFGEVPFGDITKQEIKVQIPEYFDVLCAGFPCQPFSKGGSQNGFEDTRGTLFFDICEIVEKHKPKYLLLENVANLVTHDGGNTYNVIIKHLDELGYFVPDKPLILSPDLFGIPILRPRVYIPCVRKDIAIDKDEFIRKIDKVIEKIKTDKLNSIYNFIDNTLNEDLSDYEIKILEMWDEFYKGIDLKIIGFPIWVDFFDFENDLVEYPEWKQKFIVKNKELYQRNKTFIDKWLSKYDYLKWCVNTHRKLEWQAGDKYSTIFQCLIQFRPSGVRVKRPDKFSTLVAMNHQQIIGKFRRKISIEESKLLQSFPKNYRLSKSKNIALKQLGNSVNVDIVETVFKIIIDNYEKN